MSLGVALEILAYHKSSVPMRVGKQSGVISRRIICPPELIATEERPLLLSGEHSAI